MCLCFFVSSTASSFASAVLRPVSLKRDQALKGKSDQDSEVLKRHAEGMSGPP